MEKRIRAFVFILLAGMIFFTGCKSGMGMSASGSPAKYLETFYKGDGAELYFVKPFKWKSEEGKEWVNLDITYDFSKDSIRPLVANFSFFSEKPAKKIENVALKMSSGEKKFAQVDQIYVEKDEKNKKFYHNRHTFEMSYQDLQDLMNTEMPLLSLTANGKVFSFSNPKKWKKRSAHIREYMIEVIELNK